MHASGRRRPRRETAGNTARRAQRRRARVPENDHLSPGNDHSTGGRISVVMDRRRARLLAESRGAGSRSGAAEVRGARAAEVRGAASGAAGKGPIMRIERAALALGLYAALLSAPAGAATPARLTEAPGQARAARGGVTLAEVASGVAPGATRLGDVKALLREDTEALLATIDWSPLRLRRRYALTASLIRLDTTSTGERSLASSCTVSAAVRDAESGLLLFIVEGRARAEDSASAGARAERDALRAAVRSAVIAVPDALRRTQ
jgi:hypothetical protein